jgi:hypothetical protein
MSKPRIAFSVVVMASGAVVWLLAPDELPWPLAAAANGFSVGAAVVAVVLLLHLSGLLRFEPSGERPGELGEDR